MYGAERWYVITQGWAGEEMGGWWMSCSIFALRAKTRFDIEKVVVDAGRCARK